MYVIHKIIMCSSVYVTRNVAAYVQLFDPKICYIMQGKQNCHRFSGRLKVNMGNLYFKQRNYGRAVKYYRMALDQVPNTHKNMRY